MIILLDLQHKKMDTYPSYQICRYFTYIMAEAKASLGKSKLILSFYRQGQVTYLRSHRESRVPGFWSHELAADFGTFNLKVNK